MATRRGRALLLGAISLFVGVYVMVHATGCLTSVGGTSAGLRLLRMQRSTQFAEGVFHNYAPTSVMKAGSAFAVAKLWFSTERQRPSSPLPSVALTAAAFADPPLDDVRFAWLGHSSVLVEFEGQRLLFDPMWSERASPLALVGPRRYQPVPLPITEVPALAAVVISHDHYDHLDRDTIVQLARQDPRLPFYVPLGVGAHLERWGIEPARVFELDWWEEGVLRDGHTRLVSTPTQHFSGRGPLDRNTTQWTSWAVVGRQRRVYFGGDGGYSADFHEIGRRLGPFDLTMIEIGAYNELWGTIHAGPENALGAHLDLAGRVLLPIHWGTFSLGVHPWDEPIRTLVARAKDAQVTIVTPMLGELVRLREPPAVREWWAGID